MVIRELLIRLGLTGGEATGRDLDKVDNKVKSVTESFRGLGGVLTGVLAGISIKSIIHIADEMQSLEFRLGQMVTSTNGGAEAMDNLSKHASDARVSIESYAEAYTGIGAATHELIKSEQDLLSVTDSVAMGLQLAGANTQQTTSVMMQLTQAIAVGKLQWADMRIIMQNSDAFASRLATSLGMTLNQMVQATQGQGGGIGADKIVNALRNMSGEVKKEFASMPMTVTQAMTIIGARWDMFIHRLNRSTSAISWIADKFLWMADKIEYSLDVIVDALGGAENAVKLLGVALGAAGLLGLLWALPAAWAALTSPITLIIAGLVLLYAAGEDVYRWLNNQSSLLEKAIGPAKNYHSEIDGITGGLRDLAAMARYALNILQKLKDFMNTFQDSAQSLGDKLGTTSFAPWLKEKAGWLTDDLGQWASWANDKTFGAFDVPKMWSDSIRGIREFNINQQGVGSDGVLKNTGVNIMNPPVVPPYNASGTPQNMQSGSVTISIGSIEVPSGTTQEQADYLRNVGSSVFNDVGYKLSSLNDDMSFNRGVTK
ncbi:tape measure protein [Pantoea sp. BAV 3049]|uniref:tape measure protein n=1 Tax=Pantoea sp. BAV 3049 TaxID=2654188 RepID=UPI001E642202|nr:tape measure protein [Pantoea sp. BAV 3049]